jgi:hypothetical protein
LADFVRARAKGFASVGKTVPLYKQTEKKVLTSDVLVT